MQRKTSFTIINIEEEMMSQEICKYDYIKNLYLQKTLFDIIINFNYYLFTYYLSFIKKIFTIKYMIKSVFIINYNKRIVSKNINEKNYIKVKDNSIYLKIDENEINIPYEYIVEYSYKKNLLVLNIFAKYENDKIILNDSFLKIILVIKNDYFNNINVKIKKNMYYHLQYNKVNINVLNFEILKIYKYLNKIKKEDHKKYLDQEKNNDDQVKDIEEDNDEEDDDQVKDIEEDDDQVKDIEEDDDHYDEEDYDKEKHDDQVKYIEKDLKDHIDNNEIEIQNNEIEIQKYVNIQEYKEIKKKI